MAAQVLSGFALIINTCLIYKQTMSGRRSWKCVVRNPAIIVVLKSHFFCQRMHTILLPCSLELDSLPLLYAAALTDSKLQRHLENGLHHTHRAVAFNEVGLFTVFTRSAWHLDGIAKVGSVAHTQTGSDVRSVFTGWVAPVRPPLTPTYVLSRSFHAKSISTQAPFFLSFS